jgi:hypothetical protein
LSVWGEKNRPRYSQDGATRAEIQLCQKSGGSLLKTVALLVGAVGTDLDRNGQIQAEHTHKAFGVHSGAVIANQDPKGLDGGKGDKFLNIVKRLQANIKLLHGFCLLCYTKEKLSCIIKTPENNSCDYYNRLPIGFQLTILEEVYNTADLFLVDLT